MTFKEVRDEVISFRFNGAQTASAGRWINMRYAVAWNDQPWPFALGTALVTATSGSFTLSQPTDFGRIANIYRSDGTPLVYLVPGDFERTFYSSAVVTGTPNYYTVVGATVKVGPQPSATDAAYEMVYWKKFTTLTADGDTPLLPSEYHYMLVHGALATGLSLVNDFTWEFQEQMFVSLLGSMRDAYSADYGGTLQYVRDNVGLEPPRY